MNISLPEVMDLIKSWERDSLPIKVFLSKEKPAIALLVRAAVWPLEEAGIRVGVEGVTELFISLEGGVFDLEDAAEAPEHLREEVASRTVRCLTCALPSDITVYLYELWAAEELKP
jgi:hypothetical protein